MKDKQDTEIKAGDLVKKWGVLALADGPVLKLSKKTWVATEQDGELGLLLGDAWEPFRDHTTYLVVGSASKGLKDEHKPADRLVVQGAFQKYKLLKDVPKHGWKKGDVVNTNAKVLGEDGNENKKDTVFEWVANSVDHQHTHVVVDPVKVSNLINK